jgi:hypothetical protein
MTGRQKDEMPLAFASVLTMADNVDIGTQRFTKQARQWKSSKRLGQSPPLFISISCAIVILKPL